MIERRRRGTTRVTGAVVAVGVLLFTIGVAGIARSQGTGRPFYAVAAADGARASAALRGYLVVEQLADAGAPTAQAEMNEVEGSAYAGYPWPGHETLAVLLLAGGRAGTEIPYPLAAQSSTANVRKAEVDAGAVMLRAESGDIESKSSAQGGITNDELTIAQATSTAGVLHDVDTGKATAEARNVAEGVNVDEVITIGAVRSRAKVVSPPTGEPERSSRLEISEVTIAGQEVVIRPDGISLAGSGTPLPTENPFKEALADAGITLEYIDAVKTDDGVIAAGLRITMVRDLPEFPEPVELEMEFGRARAFAQGGERSVVGDDFDLDLGGFEPGELETNPPTDVGFDDAGSFDEPIQSDAGAPSLDSTSGPAPADQPGDDETASQLIRSGGEPALTVDSAMFYVALMVAGALLFLGGTLTRLFGVRLLWNEMNP